MARKPTVKGHVLAARNARVLYVPSTKVASSTLRRLLAEANGTFRPDLVPYLDGPTISVDQSVHNMMINGLVHMELFSDRDQREMKLSPEWWRIAAVRNPYARLYSAWENRILFRAPGQVLPQAWEECTDVIADGAIDIGATFRRFVAVLAEKPHVFGRDSHFKSQSSHFDLAPLDLTHLVRLDREGELARFTTELGQRVGKTLVPQRLNEGLGLTYRDVVDAATADLIRQIFSDDFERFDFVPEVFPAALPAMVASQRETQAIRYARSVTERLEQLSRLARYRTTTRHLAAQAMRNLGIRR